ncbi:MAG: HAMP domain-containing sensor histidine kinase [Cyanobacteriota bacterium]|nr:HAMP domain-containing sensor histidine kinase [Cyanobacteriota bacterium]
MGHLCDPPSPSQRPQRTDLGYLQISRSLADLDAEAERLWWLGHGVFLLAMALASWWLAGLAMAPLLEAYRRQEQFSADVAHELRTPLANLLALVEAEHSAIAVTPNDKAARSLDRVLAQGRRLQELIADLLLLASLERPCRQSRKQSCDLAEVTADVLEDFGETAAVAQVSLEQAPWIASARVVGVESELSRLVINLLSNAIQHSPAGSDVVVGLAQRGREIQLSVRDSGPGIPTGEQQRIFDRFTRVDPGRSRQQGGNGLGLAIAQAIARRHGGANSVQSTLGAGSCFCLALPRVD